MTDLNLAYGFEEEQMLDNSVEMNYNNTLEKEVEKNNTTNNIEKKIKKKKMDMIDERPMLNRQNDPNIPINLNDNISDNVYKKYQMNQTNQMNQMNNVNTQHNNNHVQNKQEFYDNDNTFWNRFTNKKHEVFKLFLFSLVIVLAIGIDKGFSHYLNKYINENILTNTQELIIRAAYPILIILMLWIFKAI